MSATICNSNLICCYTKQTPLHPAVGLRIQNQLISRTNLSYPKKILSRKFFVFAVTEGSAKSSKSEETIPSWAKPDSEEPPPWARDEAKDNSSQQGFEIPFYVYLLASTITAIAAVSIPLLNLYNSKLYFILIVLKIL